MDSNSIPMSGGAEDLIDLYSVTKTHDAIPTPSIGNLEHVAKLNGAMQNGLHKDIVENTGPKQNGFQDSDAPRTLSSYTPAPGDREYSLQPCHDHHDDKADNKVDNSAPDSVPNSAPDNSAPDSAPDPALPTIDPAVRERLRLSLEHNMPDLADMCFNTMSDEYQSPRSPDMDKSGRHGRDPAKSLNTARDHAYVIPNRRRLLVPFHVMEATYGKPVPMQSYDNHAPMLPLSRDVPPFLPPPMAVRAYAPVTPARRRQRPSRRTGSPTQRAPHNSDSTGAGGLRVRSLEESPRRKFAALLARCTTALAALDTADILDAHKKLTGELERRGVVMGLGLGLVNKDAGRGASQRQTSCKSDPGQGRSKTNGSSSKKASAKMDDPFTE